MPCSEKKRLSNRKNALKSTGPTSPGGKAKVALNAVKHGLRAEHLVLPGEDAAAFDGMLAAWMGDWKPPTDARRVLVEQAVAHAWRLRRCLRAEREHLLERGRRGPQAPASDRGSGSGRPSPSWTATSAGARSASSRPSRAGTEAVLDLWARPGRASPGPDTWDEIEEHHHTLLRLMGLDPEEVDPESLARAAHASRWLVEWNEMRQPTSPYQRPPADPEGEAEARALAATLAAFLAGQVAETERYLAAAFPPDRAEAEAEAELALATASAALDDSDEGRALLRYEGQHGREFRATLNQLIKLTQTGLDLVEGEEPEAEAVAPPKTAKVVEQYKFVAETPATPIRATEPAAEPAPMERRTKPPRASPPGPGGRIMAEDYPPVDPARVGRAITDYLERVRSPRLKQ